MLSSALSQENDALAHFHSSPTLLLAIFLQSIDLCASFLSPCTQIQGWPPNLLTLLSIFFVEKISSTMEGEQAIDILAASVDEVFSFPHYASL